jgi:hypothetical protein
MRMVAGAVRNVIHCHPGWIVDTRAVGSIAKRATGTLTANGGKALAAVTRSEGESSQFGHRSTTVEGVSIDPHDEEDTGLFPKSVCGVRQSVEWRTPVLDQLEKLADAAKRNGEWERLHALADAIIVVSTT